MVWTNLEFEPCAVSCVMPLKFEAYREAFDNPTLTELTAARKAIFSPNGAWAAIVDEYACFVAGFAIVGGPTEFIDKLAHAWGGIEQMRLEFLHILDEPTASVPVDMRERLLSSVGW